MLNRGHKKLCTYCYCQKFVFNHFNLMFCCLPWKPEIGFFSPFNLVHSLIKNEVTSKLNCFIPICYLLYKFDVDLLCLLKWLWDFFLPLCRERELQGTTKFRRRPPLRRGKVSSRLPVPDHIPKPPYLSSNILPEIASEHQIHDAEGIARIRAACELAARVLDYAGTLVRVRNYNFFCYNTPPPHLFNSRRIISLSNFPVYDEFVNIFSLGYFWY